MRDKQLQELQGLAGPPPFKVEYGLIYNSDNDVLCLTLLASSLRLDATSQRKGELALSQFLVDALNRELTPKGVL